MNAIVRHVGSILKGHDAGPNFQSSTWYYPSCSCGWDSRPRRLESDAQAALDEHLSQQSNNE